MKIRVVEEVESLFDVEGNPTPEMAKEIVRSRLESDSTFDLVERKRKVKTCEVVDEKTKDSGVRP